MFHLNFHTMRIRGVSASCDKKVFIFSFFIKFSYLLAFSEVSAEENHERLLILSDDLIQEDLYYVILMFCTMIAQLALNGLGYKFLWPNFPEWNVMAVPFWVGISCVFVILFTKSFLDTAKYVPRFRYLSYALILLNVIIVAFLFIQHYIFLNLMFFCTLSIFSDFFTLTIVSLIKGVRD